MHKWILVQIEDFVPSYGGVQVQEFDEACAPLQRMTPYRIKEPHAHSNLPGYRTTTYDSEWWPRNEYSSQLR